MHKNKRAMDNIGAEMHGGLIMKNIWKCGFNYEMVLFS